MEAVTKQMLHTKILVFIFLVLVLFSCASRKRILYFTDIEKLRGDTVNNLTPITIQPGDILQITISTINRDVAALFNPLPNSGTAAPGYLVDHEGNIELPLIGKVFVNGKTTEAVNTDLKAALEKSIKNAYVTTRLLNFRVSVMGDVARPGYYSVANERVSVLEALSMAGDVNLSASRKDVLLIREKEGKKQYISIDLTSSKVLSSPYYYLANNDVIYVKPGVSRVIGSSTGFQLLPTIFGAISLIFFIYSTTRR